MCSRIIKSTFLFTALLPMLAISINYAHAQTATAAEATTRLGRVVPKAIIVVGASGMVTRTTNSGNTWEVFDAQSLDTVESGVQKSAGRPEAVLATVMATSVSPNPTEGATTVNYELSQSGNVLMTVHNARGAEVLRRNEGMRQAGSNTSEFDASGLPNGVYYYRILVDDVASISGKVIVAR